MSVSFNCFSFTISDSCKAAANYNMVTDGMTVKQVEAAAKKLVFEVVNITLAMIPIAF